MHGREHLDVELHALDLRRERAHRGKLRGLRRLVRIEEVGLKRDALGRQIRHQHAFDMPQRLHVVDAQDALLSVMT